MEAPSLARSWKLQEHVWKWSRTLASAVSSLLAACLRGQRPESESLSWLWLWSMWLEALLVTTRLRTQNRNCRVWSDWKCNGLLPLVVLALSRPEKALQRFLLHLLRSSLCGICGNELEGLALPAIKLEDKKNHLFLSGWPSTTSFAITYTRVVTLRRDILVVVHPLVTHHFYCGQDCTQ